MTPSATPPAPAAKAEQTYLGGEEPALVDLFDDDVLLQVLQSDPLRIEALKELIAEVRSSLMRESA